MIKLNKIYNLLVSMIKILEIIIQNFRPSLAGMILKSAIKFSILRNVDLYFVSKESEK